MMDFTKIYIGEMWINVAVLHIFLTGSVLMVNDG